MTAAFALGGALAAAGCGGSGAAGDSPADTIKQAPAPTAAGGELRQGAAIFARSCSGCHTLTGSETGRSSGGDLLGYGFSRRALTQYTMEMPLRRPLDDQEVRAVVDYVLHVQEIPAVRAK